MGPGNNNRPRQVQPMMDLAQVAEASSKLHILLEQVCILLLNKIYAYASLVM